MDYLRAMVPATPHPDLTTALTVLCDDIFFAITGARRLDLEALRGLATRRAPMVAEVARGKSAPTRIDDWDSWVLSRCAAIAPIAPPWWLPMSDAIASGLSLEHGARGLRSLFTSKPSEKEVDRIRTLGSLAVRAVGAVLSAAGAYNGEARLRRDAVLLSLGLPEADRQKLENEPPFEAEQLDIHGNLDGKVGRAVVRGCFLAAMNEGVDPREEQAILAIARKLGLTTDEVNTARHEARETTDSSKVFGEACVDAIRYLLEPEPGASEEPAIAAARLTLPAVLRRDAITAVNVGGAVTLGKKHQIDRRGREAALALSWIAVVKRDPSYLRRADLAARHDLVAADLGDGGDGSAIRATLDRHLELELATAREAARS